MTTSGYILYVLGQYLANSKNNVASIMKHIVESNSEEIVAWIEHSDVLIIDRGFRDVIDVLNECGYYPCMPLFLNDLHQQVLQRGWLVKTGKSMVYNNRNRYNRLASLERS